MTQSGKDEKSLTCCNLGHGNFGCFNNLTVKIKVHRKNVSVAKSI